MDFDMKNQKMSVFMKITHLKNQEFRINISFLISQITGNEFLRWNFMYIFFPISLQFFNDDFWLV